MIYPSAVSYMPPKGVPPPPTALSARSVSTPPPRYADIGISFTVKPVSARQTSSACPSPEISRSRSAASAPMQACSAVMRSISGKYVLIGGKSPYPVSDISPPIACPIGSNPTFSRFGPYCPYADTLIIIILGLSALSVSYPNPIMSIVPGRKFCKRISETFTSSRKTSLPFSVRRLMARLFFPLLYCTQYADCPLTRGPFARLSSPRTDSTLITSAPIRANISAHLGPA